MSRKIKKNNLTNCADIVISIIEFDTREDTLNGVSDIADVLMFVCEIWKVEPTSCDLGRIILVDDVQVHTENARGSNEILALLHSDLKCIHNIS